MLLLSPLEAGWAGAGSAENKSTRPELGWFTADVVYDNKEDKLKTLLTATTRCQCRVKVFFF